MTLNEIQSTLAEAMKTGKLGTPVAARVHVLLPADTSAIDAMPEQVCDMLSPCFEERPAAVCTRRHTTGRLMSVLYQTAGGGTICVTVGIHARPSLQLLVIGNHGILRLEGADDFESPSETPARRGGEGVSSS